MTSMVLPSQTRARLLEVARSSLPNEACGYIAGLIDAHGQREARFVWPVRNAAQSPVRFALDGQEMIDAEVEIERKGLSIVGIFHSHPTSPPRPSSSDLDDARAYDPAGHFVHVIVSLQDPTPEVNAWRYGEGGPELVALVGAHDA